MNVHDISGAEEQYDEMNLQTNVKAQWDLQNHALSGGVTNDDVEFYTKDAIAVPEIKARMLARKDISKNFSSELETAQALSVGEPAKGSPEEEAAANIWSANPYSYGPQSNPFESNRRLH